MYVRFLFFEIRLEIDFFFLTKHKVCTDFSVWLDGFSFFLYILCAVHSVSVFSFISVKKLCIPIVWPVFYLPFMHILWWLFMYLHTINSMQRILAELERVCSGIVLWVSKLDSGWVWTIKVSLRSDSRKFEIELMIFVYFVQY